MWVEFTKVCHFRLEIFFASGGFFWEEFRLPRVTSFTLRAYVLRWGNFGVGGLVDWVHSP